jgi:acyl carrier protein
MGNTSPATASVADRLRPILEDVFCVPGERMAALPQDLSSVRLAEDLGGDSLDWVELTMKAEDAFGVEISDDEGEALRTAGDAIALIERKLAVKAA